MKHVDTWLNEKDHKEYIKRAEKKGKTPYALTRELILNFLYKEQNREVAFTIAYWFLLYSIIVGVFVVLF